MISISDSDGCGVNGTKVSSTKDASGVDIVQEESDKRYARCDFGSLSVQSRWPPSAGETGKQFDLKKRLF